MKTERAFDRAQLRNLGRQIRSLREHRGLSLNQLARQSGISVTGIRNIEFGRANPGLLTVVAILDVLGVSLDELVGLARRAGKTVHVARAPARAQRDSSVQRQLSEIYQPHVRGRMVTLPAGTDLLTARKADGGPHFAFVLEGKVRVVMSDGPSHELSAGDAIHLADQPPRVVANAGDRTARLLWVKDSRSETRIDASLDRGR
ncbi:MAG: helix-turn-helix domain-containing protein [Alphaproteobacteria bacterium]